MDTGVEIQAPDSLDPQLVLCAYSRKFPLLSFEAGLTISPVFPTEIDL